MVTVQEKPFLNSPMILGSPQWGIYCDVRAWMNYPNSSTCCEARCHWSGRVRPYLTRWKVTQLGIAAACSKPSRESPGSGRFRDGVVSDLTTWFDSICVTRE